MTDTELKRRKAICEAAHVDEIDDVSECAEIIRDLPSAQPETHDKRTETHECDLISRQAAIDEIKEIYEWHDNVTKERIIEHFERLPSAHSERKKGKWLVDEDGNMECPFCGNTCGFGNYCNECGADLRGESNEFI